MINTEVVANKLFNKLQDLEVMVSLLTDLKPESVDNESDFITIVSRPTVSINATDKEIEKCVWDSANKIRDILIANNVLKISEFICARYDKPDEMLVGFIIHFYAKTK